MDARSSVLRAALEGARLSPSVVREPAILTRWLIEARSAQCAAALFAAFLVFGLPILSDGLERLYPPVESRNAFVRIFAGDRPDPRLEARQLQLTALIWTLGLSGVTALLFSTLPRAVRRVEESARSQVPLDRSPVEDADLRALRAAETIAAPVAGLVAATERVGERYCVQKELGRGAMGVVYQAFDAVLEREVALKELPAHQGAQSELARRFRQEALLLARLCHPHIVQVYDLVDDGARVWIAMELVRGGTLSDAIARAGGAFAWPRAVALGRQVAAGLEYAHASGVIHRDVKPINVLLTKDEGGVAKLTDFGLARLLEGSVHTQAGTLLGSARYMSPEQAGGQPTDARSDVYAFGVTLYEMIAGRAPFEGEVRAVLAQHIAKSPPPLRQWRPGAPEELERLVLRLLSKRPEDRPATLEPVIAALAALERTGVDAGN